MAATSEPFGRVLRRLREQARLTQEQLAERAGLSSKAISTLERGERQHPYPHTIRTLATALGLSSQEKATLEAAASRRGQRVALPAPLTPLIGREADLRAVSDLLVAGRTRLLTLTGTGGVGKTRLAVAAAGDLTPQFADGVVFVSLAPLRDPELVVLTIARGLDVRESGAQPLRDVLHGYLRSRRILLVLDNFEHLLSAAPEVGVMLSVAPRLAVLATSRSPLRLQGEQVRPVPPLELGPAVELFRDRVARADPNADTGNSEVVAEICRRLDRLPLAIELAAARIRVLPAAALQGKLDQALTVLTGGARDLPERQRTLRETIAWSHDQLSPPEQNLFRRVAVFAGGWTLDAATALSDLDEGTALELHARLVDSSLVTAQPGARMARFGLLETVHAFARERLEASGEMELIKERHAAYYRDVVLAAGDQLWGPAQPELLDRLELEHGNLRAALRHLLERERPEDVARMCFALWLFWLIRGHLREGQRWSEAALAASGPLGPSGRARLFFCAAMMRLFLGHSQEASVLAEDAVQLARVADDQGVLAWTLISQSFVAIYSRRPELAAPILEEAEPLSRSVNEPSISMLTILARAHVAAAAGRLAEAEELLVACEAEARARRMPWTLSAALNIRAHVTTQLGELERTENLLRESVVVLASLRDDSFGMMHILAHLATAAALRSNPERAARLFGATDALFERTGGSIFPIWQDLGLRCRAAAAAQLGPQAFEELRLEGRGLPPEAVVELAVLTD